MLECLLETTSDLRHHTYLHCKESGMIFAYRMDTGSIKVFTKPMSFSKRYRTFKKVVDKELLDAIIKV